MLSGRALMLLAVVFLTGSHVCVKLLSHLPFYQVVFLRGFVTLVLTLIPLVWFKISPIGINKRDLLLRGAFGTIALNFFFLSIHKLPLALAITTNYISPIFTAIIAIFLLKEKVSVRQWIFYAIAFLGVVVLKTGGEVLNVFIWDERGVYILYGLIGAFFAAMAYVYVRKLGERDNHWVIMFYFSLVVSVVMAPFAVHSWVSIEGGRTLIVIFAMGFLTQLGQYFLTRAFVQDPAAKVSIIKYVGVVLSALVGWLVFEEKITVITSIGIALILVALWTSQKEKIVIHQNND